MRNSAKTVQLELIASPKPFVKWAGGKRQLLDRLIEHAPRSYNTYLEPFIGGGALMFALMPSKCIISDINAELINTYNVIREDVYELLDSLEQHTNDEKYFYAMRARNTIALTSVERASRFIYLNKTCFNGLYRENSKGFFNVPFGRYENPNIVDTENLIAVSKYLNDSDVQFLNQDYIRTAYTAKKGDFVYFDPPYLPASKTASFTKYAKSDFTVKDQERLSIKFSELANRGCYVLLSNSNMPFIKELYKDFEIIEIEATRAINCKAEKRGKGMYEVIVKSYYI